MTANMQQAQEMTTSLPLSAALTILRDLARARGDAVSEWFAAQHRLTPPPFYSSVDLRHSGFKLAPVDTNLFPAGFNHLSKAARARAVAQIRQRLAHCKPDARRCLIIPENHTRNQGYINNLHALSTLLEEAGQEVRIGSLIAQGAPISVTTSEGVVLEEHPLTREGTLLRTTDGFTPDFILLNNDMTSGHPDLLRGLTQPVTPRADLGWHRRRKTIHFEAYDRLARDFAAQFGLDPWVLATEWEKCGRVNFAERTGLECVATAVEKVLHAIRGHYAQYGIAEEPYVFVKSDAGTYGMGIMVVRSGEELLELNKKNRNKMHVIKEGVESSEVMIQEGIPSIDRIEGHPAEPMLYLVNGIAVGGAYRINTARDAQSNLNASGMEFRGMCDEDESSPAQHVTPCHFAAYSIVSQLASLAAEREEYGEGYVI